LYSASTFSVADVLITDAILDICFIHFSPRVGSLRGRSAKEKQVFFILGATRVGFKLYYIVQQVEMQVKADIYIKP